MKCGLIVFNYLCLISIDSCSATLIFERQCSRLCRAGAVICCWSRCVVWVCWLVWSSEVRVTLVWCTLCLGIWLFVVAYIVAEIPVGCFSMACVCCAVSFVRICVSWCHVAQNHSHGVFLFSVWLKPWWFSCCRMRCLACFLSGLVGSLSLQIRRTGTMVAGSQHTRTLIFRFWITVR